MENLMKFEIDSQTDGLVFIDPKVIKELIEEHDFSYDFSLLLDRKGETDLIYDFPKNKEWKEIWKQETKKIIDFCNTGKLVIFLSYPQEESNYELEIRLENEQVNSDIQIYIPTGNLLITSGVTLVEALSFFDMEAPEKIAMIKLEPGWYSILFEENKCFKLKHLKKADFKLNNVVELDKIY